MDRKFLFILLAAALTACTGNTFYTESQSVDASGWNMSQGVSFTLDVPDTTQCYDMLLYISNTTDYPYQNLWMQVTELQPGGQVVKDTIQIFLADNRGEWLGNGVGSLKEMPVLYRPQTRFHKAGQYTFTIKQLMRDTVLLGIQELGMRLDKVQSSK